MYPNRFSDSEAAIEEALAKSDIGYINLYLLHALNEEQFDVMVNPGAVKRPEELNAKAKRSWICIRNIAWSKMAERGSQKYV